MYKYILILICLLSLALPTWASQSDTEIPISTQNACDTKFQRMVKNKIKVGVPSKHLPRLSIPQNGPSSVTVILIHGLFESPYFLRRVGERFRMQNYNTLSILLPGQWEEDAVSSSRVSFSHWLDELDQAMLIASCLGPRVVFAGHSLGGTVALVGALKYPDYTAGLLLWAPALKLKPLPTVGGAIGAMTGMSGNLFLGKRPDMDEIPYYSGNQANEVRRLGKFILARYGVKSPSNEKSRPKKVVYEKITAPTFLVLPMNDPAIQPKATLKMYNSLGGEKRMIVYASDSDIWHGNVAKSSSDTYKVSPNDFNMDFDNMMDQIEGFIHQQINTSSDWSTPLRELDEPTPPH